MTTTLCHSCAAQIENHQGALQITFSGYGDAGFIDTFGSDEPQLVICAICAALLRGALAPLTVLDPCLNINYSHVCNGEFKPTPMPTCPDDPDQHGWREVFTVVPAARPSLELWYVCDTEGEAAELAAACAAAGHQARVVRSPIGNLRHSDAPRPPLG